MTFEPCKVGSYRLKERHRVEQRSLTGAYSVHYLGAEALKGYVVEVCEAAQMFFDGVPPVALVFHRNLMRDPQTCGDRAQNSEKVGSCIRLVTVEVEEYIRVNDEPALVPETTKFLRRRLVVAREHIFHGDILAQHSTFICTNYADWVDFCCSALLLLKSWRSHRQNSN